MLQDPVWVPFEELPFWDLWGVTAFCTGDCIVFDLEKGTIPIFYVCIG